MTKLALVLTLGASLTVWGQDVISAHSGTVHYVEGTVTLDGDAIEPHFAQFPAVANDHVLATEQGRAEVLMNPGVFLRLSEDSSFRMISNRLSDTKIEVVSGDALLEVDDLAKDNAITVDFLGTSTALTRKGLYRFDADRKMIRVYQGLASTTMGEQTINARTSKEIQVGEKLTTQFFDSKDTDPFYRWAERRAEYVATANISAARQAGQLGLLSDHSSWAWNPFYGMFTFLPGYGYAGYNGFGYSPFGYYYYSPVTVGYFLPTVGSYYGNPRPVATVSRGSTLSSGTSSNGIRGSTLSPTASSPAASITRGGPSLGTSTGSLGSGRSISSAPSVGVSTGGGGGASVSSGTSRGAAAGGGGAHR